MRLDHIAIAVRDLDRAAEQYGRMGFDVRPGGKHTGLGSHNALIRFGLDFLELVAIHDREEAASSGAMGQVLLELLEGSESALAGYCLATTELDKVAAELGPIIPGSGEPFRMERKRPDGRLLEWHLFIPANTGWLRPWPFFIERPMSDDELLTIEQPGNHRLGVSGVSRLSVAARDMAKAGDIYRRLPGLTADNDGRRFTAGAFEIELTDAGGGNEGARQIRLAVADVKSATSGLEDPGVLGLSEAGDGLWQISPEMTWGVPIFLEETRR
ncbi:MAG: hypothetical protein GEU28_01330 [Dehalococcoidia bacterium]|nr:hypothetical protein [Dehalococcoidia bacterium]